MARLTPTSDRRGLVLPDPATLTATYTATSQAGPRAGALTPSQSTGLLLYGTGEVDATSDTASGIGMVVQTHRSGGVGTATIRWRYDTDALRSWDPPVMLSGWEMIARSTTAQRYRAPHVIRRRSTGQLVAAVTYDTNTVHVYRQTTKGKWNSTALTTTGYQTRGTLVELASGRLVLLYSAQQGSSVTQVVSAYSDDGGATWTQSSAAALVSPIAATGAQVERLRAVELGGAIMLLVWSQPSADTVAQYVSTDGGASFALVETTSTAAMGYPDAYVYQGQIYVGTLEYDAAYTPVTIRPYVRRLASASQALSSVQGVHAGSTTGDEVFGTYSAGAFTAGDLSIVVNDDGFVYVLGVDFSATGVREIITRVSDDGAESWTYNWVNSHNGPFGTTLAYTGNSASTPRELTATCERGRIVVLHGCDTAPGGVATRFPTLGALYAGGWSTLGFPAPTTTRRWECAGWDHTYLPLDIPTDQAAGVWTKTTVGTPTESLTDTGLRGQTSALESLYWEATPSTSGDTDAGAMVEARVQVDSGNARMQLRISDGTNAYEVAVVVGTTTIALNDITSGTTIGTISMAGSDGVTVRIALKKGTGAWSANTGAVRAWARVDGPATGGALVLYGPRADREWTSIGSSTALQSAAAATNRLRFGSVLAAGDSRWMYIAFSGGLRVAGNDTTSGGTARGHVVPPAGSPVHITDGFRIHGASGPGAAGDEYTTAATHDYPVSAVNPSISPSPRRKWRSTADSVAQDIVLSGVDLGARSGDVWCVYVAGANWRTASLYADNTGTVKLCDIDLSAGLTGLRYVRTRDLVYPGAVLATSAEHYLHEQSLVGAYVDFGGGVVRKIAHNGGGAWMSSTSQSYAQVRVRLDSYDAGDPTAGTCALRMPRGVTLFEGMPSTNTLMLRIDAQDTEENYLTLGTLLIGRVRWFGRQYSRGRAIQVVPNYALTETRGGARMGRKLGPTRRAVELSWDDGIDTSQIAAAGTGTAPDYWDIGYSGARPLANPADTAMTLAGVIDAAGGATLPAVLLAGVPAQSTAFSQIRQTNPEAFLYGRLMTESLRIDADASVMGDELRSPGEMVTVATVRLEEEV